MYFGYHRVSTTEQNPERGILGIEDFCRSNNYPLESVYVDKISGKRFDRPRYTVLKEDILREGDTLILWELDRLGRTKEDINEELRYFSKKGIRVMLLDIPTTTIDVSGMGENGALLLSTINTILVELLGMQAQSEYARNRKRCDEGRDAMKARGDWHLYGRQRIISKEDFAKQYLRVVNKEIGSLALMRELNLSNSTYHRYVQEYRNDAAMSR